MGKWESYNLLIGHNEEVWKTIFNICFKSIRDNSIIWFQYRILFGILPTRYLLKKFNLSESNTCVFCKEHEETIFHMFCQCHKVVSIWRNIESWICNKIGKNIKITDSMIIFGSPEKSKDYWPINFIILATKRYVYWCSKRNFTLNIYFLQLEIKKLFDEQRLLAKLNLKESSFLKSWDPWIEIYNIT